MDSLCSSLKTGIVFKETNKNWYQDPEIELVFVGIVKNKCTGNKHQF